MTSWIVRIWTLILNACTEQVKEWKEDSKNHREGRLEVLLLRTDCWYAREGVTRQERRVFCLRAIRKLEQALRESYGYSPLYTVSYGVSLPLIILFTQAYGTLVGIVSLLLVLAAMMGINAMCGIVRAYPNASTYVLFLLSCVVGIFLVSKTKWIVDIALGAYKKALEANFRHVLKRMKRLLA